MSSILLTNANGRADMGASPPTLSALTIACWYYQNSANYYDRRGIASISTTNGADDDRHFALRNYDGMALVGHRNASIASVVYSGTMSKGSWQLMVIRASTSANSIRLRRNTSGAEVSETLSGSNPMAAFRYISVGAWNPACPTDHITNAANIAHLTFWNRDLTNGEVDSLYNGAGTSINPTTVQTSDIFAYWDGSSLTSQIGGFTLASVQGTLSIASGTNPDVDAYVPDSAFDIVQSGNIAVAGALAIAGDISAQGQFWRVPTNAPTSTAVHVTVFSGNSPTYAILAQGATTVNASGFAMIPAATGTPGDKALAFVHNYNDNTASTSIYGGPSIATRYQGV